MFPEAAPRRSRTLRVTYQAGPATTVSLTKELWQAAVNLRGNIEPAAYKRYVLPVIFLRFLSLRYEHRRAQLEGLVRGRGQRLFRG